MQLLELAISQEPGRTYSLIEVAQTCDRAIYVYGQLAEGSDA